MPSTSDLQNQKYPQSFHENKVINNFISVLKHQKRILCMIDQGFNSLPTPHFTMFQISYIFNLTLKALPFEILDAALIKIGIF